METEQKGWYTDPWGRHEARWMSEGVPTRLVRDGNIESFDEPPDAPPSRAWARIADPRVVDGEGTALQPPLADDILSPPVTEPGAFGMARSENSGGTIAASQKLGSNALDQGIRVGLFGRELRQPSWQVRFAVGVVSLAVAVLLLYATQHPSNPGHTTTPTTAPRARLSVASGAVGRGCAATPAFASALSQDETTGNPVPSAEGQAKPGTPLKDIETMIGKANRWPRYSGVVSTATTFVEEYIQSAGAQGEFGWYPVISDLNAVTAQCQLLGQPAT